MPYADREFLRKSCLTGTASGLLMSTVVGMVSQLTVGRSAPGLNAISHIVWGEKAARQPTWTFRYTGTRLLLNHIACLFWAGCYEALWRKHRSQRVMSSAADAMTIALLAYVVDYHIIPKQFTPGFELVFPKKLFPVLYLGLAGALLAGSSSRVKTAKGQPDTHAAQALN